MTVRRSGGVRELVGGRRVLHNDFRSLDKQLSDIVIHVYLNIGVPQASEAGDVC